MIKKCARCGKEFDALKNAKYCPTCRPEAYREHKRESCRKYHEQHLERHREYCRKYHEQHLERYREYARKYREKQKRKLIREFCQQQE